MTNLVSQNRQLPFTPPSSL